MNPFLQLAGDLARETHDRRREEQAGRLADEIAQERRRRARKGNPTQLARKLKQAAEGR